MEELHGPEPGITPEIQKTICSAISRGLSNKDAAILADVDPRTLRNWIAKGKKGKTLYVSFFSALRRAQSKFKKRHLNNINRAGNGLESRNVRIVRLPDGSTKKEVLYKKEFDWRASAWLLERLHRDEFGDKTKREIQEAVAAEIEKMVRNGQISTNGQTGDSTTTETKKKKPLPPDAPDTKSV